MARYLLRVMYDGLAFRGWQVQCAGRSIQGDLISAFRQLGIRHPGLTGSGRTDAGVHALAHYAHFDYQGKMTPLQLQLALNTKLRDDLLVTGVWPVPQDFHARFSAMARSYIYLLAREKTPLNRLFTGFMPRSKFSLESLQTLAEHLLGSHDFSSLSRDNPLVPNHICTLSKLDIYEWRDLVRFDITADRFLHNMVRRIVGTLVNLSHFDLGPQELLNILAEKNPRQRLVVTAPAQGLYLSGVRYPNLQLDETPLP
ncbi:MAG: tRNA pseudouridine(38-40) synthase TruA [Candidatus Cloacimonadota bacterium]|mgnify:CR=1 FL=1|nr:tRNA pseudouridine(38-40) synthase TruA [Candidatus Cloacimonadota bacterium]